MSLALLLPFLSLTLLPSAINYDRLKPAALPAPHQQGGWETCGAAYVEQMADKAEEAAKREDHAS